MSNSVSGLDKCNDMKILMFSAKIRNTCTSIESFLADASDSPNNIIR
jgi:hypothetical protein